MKNLKIISTIAALCISLSPASMAINPPPEEMIQGFIAWQSRERTKNIPATLNILGAYLPKTHTHSALSTSHEDLTVIIAQNLIFYIYTLYPRGISMEERVQIMRFFETELSKKDLPQNIVLNFYDAMERAPEYYPELKTRTALPRVSSPDSPISPSLGRVVNC